VEVTCTPYLKESPNSLWNFEDHINPKCKSFLSLSFEGASGLAVEGWDELSDGKNQHSGFGICVLSQLKCRLAELGPVVQKWISLFLLHSLYRKLVIVFQE